MKIERGQITLDTVLDLAGEHHRGGPADRAVLTDAPEVHDHERAADERQRDAVPDVGAQERVIRGAELAPDALAAAQEARLMEMMQQVVSQQLAQEKERHAADHTTPRRGCCDAATHRASIAGGRSGT